MSVHVSSNSQRNTLHFPKKFTDHILWVYWKMCMTKYCYFVEFQTCTCPTLQETWWLCVALSTCHGLFHRDENSTCIPNATFSATCKMLPQTCHNTWLFSHCLHATQNAMCMGSIEKQLVTPCTFLCLDQLFLQPHFLHHSEQHTISNIKSEHLLLRHIKNL
jgi:hypothetical protein